MHLLSLEIIDINARNLVGLTPLDVLLETTQEIGDVFIGEILRRAGGKISEEFNPRSADDAADTLLPNLVSSQNNQTNGKDTRKLTDADELSTDNLIVVAALVATVTYQAIFNPPGGFIQMPFETSDGNSTKLIPGTPLGNIFPLAILLGNLLFCGNLKSSLWLIA
jgi:Domain of unknown function